MNYNRSHAYTLGFLRGGVCPCLDWRCTGGFPDDECEYIERDLISALCVLYYRLRAALEG